MNTALDMIHDGDGVAVSGFMLMTVPREIYRAIGERFQQTGHPCGLTLMHGAGTVSYTHLTLPTNSLV